MTGSGRSKWSGGHASRRRAARRRRSGTPIDASDATARQRRRFLRLALRACHQPPTRRTHPRRARTTPTVHCPWRCFLLRLGVLALASRPVSGCGSKRDDSSATDAADAGDDSVDPQDFAAVTHVVRLQLPERSPRAPSRRRPTRARTPATGRRSPTRIACGAWDGGYPAVQPGQCTATAPSGRGGEVRRAGSGRRGHDHPARRTTHRPRRQRLGLRRAGPRGRADDVPRRRSRARTLVVTVDDGPVDHAVRVIDRRKIGSGSTPVTGYVKFADPETLNSAAAFVGARAPSTSPPTTASCRPSRSTRRPARSTRTDAQSITLPPGHDETATRATGTSPGLAASPGRQAPRRDAASSTHTLLVYDVDPTSPTFRQLLGQVGHRRRRDVPGLRSIRTTRPGKYAYVSMWADKKVLAGRREHAERALGRADVRDRHGPRGRRLPRRALDGRGERPRRHALARRPHLGHGHVGPHRRRPSRCTAPSRRRSPTTPSTSAST